MRDAKLTFRSHLRNRRGANPRQPEPNPNNAHNSAQHSQKNSQDLLRMVLQGERLDNLN